jgi:mannosyltransferase
MPLSLKSKMNLDGKFWAIVIVMVIAFVLRMYRLGANDLWYDEAYSIIISRGSWQCWNPPLYFAILHYWVGIFGMSEFALRFPSALFSIFGIYTTFLFGQRLFNFRIGLFSAILMSFSAFNLWYAQEARPYSLSVFLSVASTYFLYKALTETKRRFWGFFILSSFFLLYCDITYSSVVLLGAQLLSAAIFFRKKFSMHIFYFFCILVFFYRA